MPKKDTAAAVLGMLSTAGAQTRRTPETTAAAEQAAAPGTVTVTEVAPAPVTTLPTPVRPTPATRDRGAAHVAAAAGHGAAASPSLAGGETRRRAAHRTGFRVRPRRRGAGPAPAPAERAELTAVKSLGGLRVLAHLGEPPVAVEQDPPRSAPMKRHGGWIAPGVHDVARSGGQLRVQAYHDLGTHRAGGE